MAQAIVQNIKYSNQFSSQSGTQISDESAENFDGILDEHILSQDEKTEKQSIVSNKTSTLSQILTETVEAVEGEISLDMTISDMSEEIVNVDSEMQEVQTENQDNSQIGENQEMKEIQQTIPKEAVFISHTSPLISLLSDYENTETTDENSPIKLRETYSEIKLTVPEEDTKSVKSNNDSKLKDVISKDELEDLNIETVEVQNETASGDSSGDLMKNQTPQEQGIKVFLGINSAENQENSYTKTGNVSGIKSNITPEVNPSKIIEQVSKQLEGMNGSSKVNIVLNPESLGKISLQIINSKDGLYAQFNVLTNDARNLLLNGLDGLKEALLAQGVNVDNILVKLNETQNSEYNADWTEQEGNAGSYKRERQNEKDKNKQNTFEELLSLNSEDKENVWD